MNRLSLFGVGALLLSCLTGRALAAEYKYPFQNPDLPIEVRVENLVSLMTLDEKIACLGTNPSVPRLGVLGTNHIEGLHGAQLSMSFRQRYANQQRGNAAGYGGDLPVVSATRAAGALPTQPATSPTTRASRPRFRPVPTTIFPQEIGMGETWDTEVIRQAAALEGNEMRYAFLKYRRGGLVLRAPNADLGRDPRWGRTEECFGEDPFFNGSMVVAFVNGLQGTDPKYLQAASLMKHFLANSNEDTRTKSSSDFDERLFQEYYSVPFRMGVTEANAQAFMASYNKVNGIPDTV
jgi:beta-glucosidase